MFRAGDTVKHGPTGETWAVAYDDGTWLAWCGWPPGEAKSADCTLVESYSDAEHVEMLQRLAKMGRDDRGHADKRQARAIEALKALGVAAALLLALLLAPCASAWEPEPGASVRGHVGYSAVMTEDVAGKPAAVVEVDAPVSLGRASVARVQAKLQALGIAGRTLNVGDVRTFGSFEFELALRRRVGSDQNGGATYIGIRGGGAALRNAAGREPHLRNPLWYSAEVTLERRDGEGFPHRSISIGFGHSDISSPPLRTPGTLAQAARDAIPRDLIVSGSVSIDGPGRSKLIISGDVHRGLYGPRASTQVRVATTAAWG